MHHSVSDAFLKIIEDLNGFSEHLYTDVKNRVLVGFGLQVWKDEAPFLHFRWKDTNRRATAAECKEEVRVTYVRGKRGAGPSAPIHTQLYITRQDALRASLNKLLQLDDDLQERWPKYRYWPADAQLALLLLAYHGQLGAFEVEEGRFDLIAGHYSLYGTPSKLTKIAIDLLHNAQKVVDHKAIPSRLWYPEIPNSLVELKHG